MLLDFFSKELIGKYGMYFFGIVLLLILLFRIDSWGVSETSEARYAQISKEMLESNDFLHPQLMGIKHYHKPPVTYWITVISFKIFGIDSYGARFPLQVAVLIQVFLIYGIAMILFKDRFFAFYAAVLYFSLPAVIISTRALTTDAFLTTFILASIYSWMKAIDNNSSNRKVFYLLFYVFLGLGFATKGPVVIIFPLIVIVALRMQGKRMGMGYYMQILGLIVFLAIGFSWFIYLFLEDQRFFNYFFFNHTIERFATDTFQRSEPFWFYLLVIPATSFPWAFFLFRYLFHLRKLDYDKVLLFSFWILVPVIFFSISQSKLILYVLPVYSGIALGSIWVWRHINDTKKNLWGKISFIYHIISLVVLALYILFSKEIKVPNVFFLISIISVVSLVFLRFNMQCLTSRTFLSALIFTSTLILNSTYIFSKNPHVVNDQTGILSYIKTEYPDTENLLVFNRRLPSVQFHSDLNIVSLYYGNHDLNRETQFEKNDRWKENLLNLIENPELIEVFNSPSNILISRKKAVLPGNFMVGWEKDTIIDKWSIYKYK
jgi:4-amino-4-deoxy-L-arabinose transferase